MKVTIQNIFKTFSGKDIFTNFSLDVDSGVRLCVVGRNGCGKSTLLKMIAGTEMPDAGRIIIPKGSRIGYVKQDLDSTELEKNLLTWMLTIFPDWNMFWNKWEHAVALKNQEELLLLKEQHAKFEMMYGYNPEYQVKKILSGLGFKEDTWSLPLAQLSGGWRERAKLARVLVGGSDVLLLDEPTNHLDIEAVEWLENFLREYKGILIFVAHDKIFMDKVGDHILYLGGAKPIFRKMSFSQFLLFREEIEEQKAREVKRIHAEIEHKMDFVKRFGAKASKARQASSRQKMAKKLQRELESIHIDKKQKTLCFTWPEISRSDKVLISANNLSFSFPRGNQLWPPLTFSVESGKKIALVGPNGIGKSTLLKLIVGVLEPSGGSIVQGNLVRIGYFSQHQTEILDTSSTVLSEIRRLSDPKATEEELMSILGLFLLDQEYFDRSIAKLSGGERNRLVLASLFLTKANFLILDEPTNHLDLESREALVKSLKNFTGTILMIAHDRYLLNEVAEEIWSVSDKGIIFYNTSFKQYNELYRQGSDHYNISKEHTATINYKAKETFSRDELKKRKRAEAEKRSKIYSCLKPKQEEYCKLEEDLGTLLEKQTCIERLLIDPDVYNDKEKTMLLLEDFTSIKDKIEYIVNALGVLEIEILDIKNQV